MKPAPFAYHRAGSVDEATAHLHQLGSDARLLAGGQSLMPLLNLRLVRPAALVDVNRIPGLDGISASADGLRVGALARHRALESSTTAPGGLSVLSRAARSIGQVSIRAWGTIGGSLAHADPAAEWCLLAVALDAEIHAVSRRGRRVLAAADLLTGPFRTSLEPDEVVVEVVFPWVPDRAGFDEHARRPGGPALVSAVVAYELDDGRITSPHVAVGGGQLDIARCAAAEGVLAGAEPSAELFRAAGDAAASTVGPSTVGPSTVGAGRGDERDRYRLHLVAHLVAAAGADAMHAAAAPPGVRR